MKFLAIYLLLGAILSTAMYMLSVWPLPLAREILAHSSIVLFWPLVLVHTVRIFRRTLRDK